MSALKTGYPNCLATKLFPEPISPRTAILIMHTFQNFKLTGVEPPNNLIVSLSIFGKILCQILNAN